MSVICTLTGRIEEAWAGLAGGEEIRDKKIDFSNNIRLHNANIIRSFSCNYEDYPPLLNDMFYQIPDHGLLKYRTPLIIFGCTLRYREGIIDEWKSKFEILLKQLFWESVIVDIDLEYFGCKKLEWRVDHSWTEKIADMNITTIEKWNYQEKDI